MKKTSRILAVILCLALLFALTACAKKDSGAENTAAPSESAAPSSSADPGNESEEFPSYTIGYTSHGAGMWIIDLCRLHVQYYLEDVLGFGFQSLAANFSADQMLKDVQNSCQAGQDGHMYTNTWDNIMESCSEVFENAQMPWVNYDQPVSETMFEMAQQNPYFVGSAASDPYAQGYSCGEQAAADGYKAAGLIAGAIGESTCDLRIKGFTDAFEAGGGKVIAAARCSDPTEATAKADDLVAAHGSEFDCIFGMTSDFTLPLMQAMENYGYSCYAYNVEPDVECLDMIKNGEMSACTPSGQIASTMASILLINYLDGHPMLDESGSVPYITSMPVWMVTPDNADLYQKYTIDGYEIAEQDYLDLLYRSNPDVTYDDYCEFLNVLDADYIAARG